MCAISSLTSTFAISSPDEFLSIYWPRRRWTFGHSRWHARADWLTVRLLVWVFILVFYNNRSRGIITAMPTTEQWTVIGLFRSRSAISLPREHEKWPLFNAWLCLSVCLSVCAQNVTAQVVYLPGGGRCCCSGPLTMFSVAYAADRCQLNP